MKLIKTNDGYNLVSEQPQGKLLEATCSEKELKSLTKNHITLGKLSLKNCDSLFGVVDVENLDRKIRGLMMISGTSNGTIDHPNTDKMISLFNKAMELNKDKLFTLEDIERAINFGVHVEAGNIEIDYKKYGSTENQFIQSLQQPTEIEVEIVMKNSRTGKIIKSEADLEWDEDGLCDKAIPKLDSSGNLILKKI